jgi:hypothetical protein
MKYCVQLWLVSLSNEYSLPLEPWVANDGRPPFVGCNHIICKNCDSVVKHVDRRAPLRNSKQHRSVMIELYESNAPETSLLFSSYPRDEDLRTYFCRCDWQASYFGALQIDTIDQFRGEWRCGGHPPAAIEDGARATEILRAREVSVENHRKRYEVSSEQRANDYEQPAMAKAVAAAHANGTKINLASGAGDEAFATASELGHCLLLSLLISPSNPYPSWAWLNNLIRTRSDWWPSIGVAMQFAALQGALLECAAPLSNLLASSRETVALLPWTTGIAENYPDIGAKHTETGWGAADLRLETIIQDQTAFVAIAKQQQGKETSLIGYGDRGSTIQGSLTNESNLRKLLDASAHAGQFPDENRGPWSWLGFELIIGGAYLHSNFLKIVATMATADLFNICALLDWFFEQRDLWTFISIIEGWEAANPSWWNLPVQTKPQGWMQNMRSCSWPGVTTLGDIALYALARGIEQRNTPSVLDLSNVFRVAM